MMLRSPPQDHLLPSQRHGVKRIYGEQLIAIQNGRDRYQERFPKPKLALIRGSRCLQSALQLEALPAPRTRALRGEGILKLV